MPKPIFRSDEDYSDFVDVLSESVERFESRILAFCALPKHWHLVVTPRQDGDLSKLVAWITITHSSRWHTKPKRAGLGGLYERRFRSFPIQDNASLLDVMHFVESHPLRSGLAIAAKDWRWSSAAMRANDQVDETPFLSSPPIAIPINWHDRIDLPMEREQLEKICNSIKRGAPYGDATWVQRTATRMNLESTLRPRGRPKL